MIMTELLLVETHAFKGIAVRKKDRALRHWQFSKSTDVLPYKTKTHDARTFRERTSPVDKDTCQTKVKNGICLQVHEIAAPVSSMNKGKHGETCKIGHHLER